jgi:hypothetical protein
MSRYTHMLVGAAMMVASAFASPSPAHAADLALFPTKVAPIVDMPFFLINDNRLTYAYIFDGTDPGYYSRNPNGSLNSTEAKQIYAFTHFDAWAYGTNTFSAMLSKSGKNYPAAPCTNAGVIGSVPADCAGTTEVFGTIRSTLGFNEIFNTKAFTVGPLHNVSFIVGANAGTGNSVVAEAPYAVVGGLQFAFDLPYHGYFNVSPLFDKSHSHDGPLQCGGPVPAARCLVDGNKDFDLTWSVETNYYMDLGFLPESVRYFSISGRATWVGTKGSQNDPAPGTPTAIELNSEPIRLTFDASKAAWGPKYSHFVDVWVAYRYWQNKYGYDHNQSSLCVVSPGVSNNTCTESSLYSGLTVKF